MLLGAELGLMCAKSTQGFFRPDSAGCLIRCRYLFPPGTFLIVPRVTTLIEDTTTPRVQASWLVKIRDKQIFVGFFLYYYKRVQQ
jgi:hypothetical protein